MSNRDISRYDMYDDYNYREMKLDEKGSQSKVFLRGTSVDNNNILINEGTVNQFLGGKTINYNFELKFHFAGDLKE